ncbi:fungal-specific transcription factor domain-containing protein [Boeremia exigua]|uniref:fungal-specific transcription factor domain-containing protein n=1 Tax=Boeremia exigua TaxID=749465 RepID=UPI001E8E5138|nr:fungal-specific transcription factor domain-containing protein [Boeremia exigua]KAH6621778.1 fungal-specific transcription factor domain-containing protein [Boeremia exigua]
MLQPSVENHPHNYEQQAPPAPTPIASSSATIEGGQSAANRKSRIALACKRCKRRKQRCDGARPSCQACDRVKQACTYERIARPQYPGGKALYISALEERIAFLEARLPDHATDHLDGASEVAQQSPVVAVAASHPVSQARRGSHRGSQAGSNSEEIDSDDGTSLVNGVAYLSLCASGTTDTNHEPYYVGSSSGAIIAHAIQSSIYRRPSTQPADLATPTQKSPASTPPAPRYLSSALLEPDAPTSALPNQTQARMLFDFFFERIHPRWPLLDRAVFEKLFDGQYRPGFLSITQRSLLHLIYAITARFLAVTKKPCGVDDEVQLSAATEPMDHILKQHDLATVQFLILLAVHGQRSPYGAGAWSQVRYATSVCIEMGLHRNRSVPGSTAYARDTEIRRRAFWSCYCLDRVISIVLGRSFAIADRDISVEFPSASPEFWTLTHRDEYDTNGRQWSNVQPFIHIIKLDRIQSRIQKTVFRVDKDVVGGTSEERIKLDSKMSMMRKDLDDWLASYPQTPKNDNKSTWMYDPENAYLDARDFYGVQYHKAVLFLFTIFLPTLETSDERFVTCAHSAASVCNTYKRLSQNKTLTYTMISLHSCFVAGLTLVYCIWRDRKLFSYEVIEATQSCSQILTIFGEKWPGAVKYRDIFDALSQSLFKLTMEPLDTARHTKSPPSLQLNIEKQSVTAGQSLQGRNPPMSPDEWQATKPTMSHLVTDAVKEAFMEVDEEAPGGWQGWRMWNEMVTDEDLSTLRPAGIDSVGDGLFEANWNSYQGSAVYGTDPIQDATMQLGNDVMLDQHQWHFSGYT